EVHKAKLRLVGSWPKTDIRVTGVPRFDYYFEPWSRVFRPAQAGARERPRVLLCTNFQLAHFWKMPKAQAGKFFAAWKDRVPLYGDYWKTVEDSYQASLRVLDYAKALVETERYEVVLRPHPRENPAHYAAWVESLPEAQRRWTRLDAGSEIS